MCGDVLVRCEAAADLDEVYRLVIDGIDGEDFTLASTRDGARIAAGRGPALVLTAPRA